MRDYAGRFSSIAPALRARGWSGLIPLRPSSKAPALRGWEAFNEGQTDAQLSALIRSAAGRRPGSGVGAAAGNGVLGLDLDLTEAQAAVRAVAIAEDVLGRTPLHRIGKPPKRMLFYRSEASYKRMNPGGLALEVYPGSRPASGQVVLFGRHPDGDAYHWPQEDPRLTPFGEIPEVTREQLDNVVIALTADPLTKNHGQALPGVPGGDGHSSALPFRQANAAMRSGQGLPQWLASIAPGARHNAALAGAIIIVGLGLDVDEEAAELESLECAFLECKPEATATEWRNILRWARQHAAPRYRRDELVRRLGLEASYG